MTADVIHLGATAAYTYAFRGTEMTLDDYLVSIAALPSLGLRYFDLEILQGKHVPIYADADNAAKLHEALKDNGVNIAGFTAWACVAGLHSLDEGEYQQSLDLFAQIAALASQFGASYVHLGSDMVQEFIAERDPTYASAPPQAFAVPPEVKWERVLAEYAGRLRAFAQIAGDHGMKFAIEPRANAVISGADAFLHVAGLADHANLYCCLDVMHAAHHREDVPLAIAKLGEKLAVVQLCNARGGAMVHRPLDDGEVALEPIVKTLATRNFAGHLMIECYIGGKDDQATVNGWYREGAKMVRGWLGE